MGQFGKLCGGILLITGTSIGGGMLALPLANADAGFLVSSATLFACWCLMTFTSMLILEVNLWLPDGSNMISMAQATLGDHAKYLTWVAYLLLFYTLLSGYISAGTDLIDSALALINMHFPLWLDSTLFVTVLGSVVYFGVQSVDYVNRGLMFGKLGVFVLLMVLLLPHIHMNHLVNSQNRFVAGSLMVLVTSFGFAHIVPSMRTYFNDNVTQIRQVIIIGSFIPLICYILWDAAIMGVLPRLGLVDMAAHNKGLSELTPALMHSINSHIIADFFRLFISLSMLTAFLGVSLGLTDFLSDGLGKEKRGTDAFFVYSIAYLPPLALVFYKPYLFLVAMSFAGVCCIMILVLLPALMAWVGRYNKGLSGTIMIPGGKATLITIITIGSFLFVLGLKQSFAML